MHGDVGGTETAGLPDDREEHAAAVRQHLRPPVVLLAPFAIDPCQRRRRPTGGRNALQANFGIEAGENDFIVGRPCGAP